MYPDGLRLAFRKVSRPLLGFALSPAIVLSSFLTDGTVRFAFLIRRLRFSGRICSHVTTSTLTTFLAPQPLWHHTRPAPKPWDRRPVLSVAGPPRPVLGRGRPSFVPSAVPSGTSSCLCIALAWTPGPISSPSASRGCSSVSSSGNASSRGPWTTTFCWFSF